jgi:O-antigen ligase
VPAIVFPAITAGEWVTFSFKGAEMNLRVAAYFCVALLTGAAALVLLLRMTTRPGWIKLMLVMLAWFLFTALVARQSPREWLPTIVRWILYIGAAIVCYSFARSLEGPDEISGVSRFLPLALLAAAVVPAVAGTVEFVRGTAPVLNGAPRVSGSMPSHPVAFSLVLSVCMVGSIGPAIIRGRAPGALARWLAIAGLMIIVFMTFTRLSILLVVVAGAAVAFTLPAVRRVRFERLAGAVAVGALIMFLAVPTFEARFTNPEPLTDVLDVDVQVDSSIAYRIMLTEHGLKYLQASPIVGHGPGSFHRLFEAESGRANVAAHNDMLSVAVESGLPGLGLYLLTLLSLAMALWPRRPLGIADADALTVAALVILGAVNVGAAIHNPTYFVEIQLPIWILVGTALGILESGRRVGVVSSDTVSTAR